MKKIIDLYNKNQTVLSMEIFPPKADYPLETVFNTLDELIKLNPSYISVTYGAGGSSKGRTVEIAARIKKEYGIESQAHLTCIGQTKKEVESVLDDLIKEGIHNIMALRGDFPENQPDFSLENQEYCYAYQLIEDISRKAEFGIAAAAHPEGHPECRRLSEDLENLKLKVSMGVDFLITQLFFDNRIFYDFIDRAIKVGINCPIIPGIMPVLNSKQIKRMIYLCGASIPAKLLRLVDKYEDSPNDMEKAGIEYASEQLADLIASKVPGIHMYTMNKPAQIALIVNNVGL